MKKITGYAALIAIATLSLTSCLGWSTTATVGGGTGLYAPDAPYYWSDWNVPSSPPIIGYGPGSIIPSYRPQPPVPPRPIPTRPGNGPAFNPGGPGNTPGRPSAPPQQGFGPGSNPGTPQQGGFRGEK